MSRRTQRVGELLHEELADLLRRRVKDPRLGWLTITGVEVSPDLRRAKIYYGLTGSETKREEVEAGLKSAQGFIRRELGKRLRLRYTPEVAFHYDSSFDYGERIDEILKGLKD